MSNDAKRGDFVVVESVSRATTLSYYTTVLCGIVASVSRDGVAKTMRINGEGKPIKIHDVHGFRFAHIVSAARLNVAGAVKACAAQSFQHVNQVRDVIRSFLVG